MAEVSPELIKLAQNIKPQIELELKKRGIPLMADLSNSQMNEIIKKAPAMSNRLDSLLQMQEGREYGDKDLINLLKATGQEGRTVSEKDLINLRNTIGLQEGKTFSTKDTEMINRLESLMQPVGSTGIESMMMNVVGPAKFTKLFKLPTNLLDDILPPMQKVFKEFNKLTGKDKTEAAEFLKPKIADLTTRAKRTQIIEDADPMFTGSEIINKNVIALEQFDDILKNVPKAATIRKTTQANVDPQMAETVGKSFMKKSGLAEGGLLSALDRIKSNT